MGNAATTKKGDPAENGKDHFSCVYYNSSRGLRQVCRRPNVQLQVPLMIF